MKSACAAPVVEPVDLIGPILVGSALAGHVILLRAAAQRGRGGAGASVV